MEKAHGFIIVSKHELLKDPIYYSGDGCGWTLIFERAKVFETRGFAREVGVVGEIIPL